MDWLWVMASAGFSGAACALYILQQQEKILIKQQERISAIQAEVYDLRLQLSEKQDAPPRPSIVPVVG